MKQQSFWRHFWSYLNGIAGAQSAVSDHGIVSSFPKLFWACPNWHMPLAII